MSSIRCTQRLLKSYTRPSIALPEFLIPAFSTNAASRSFATTSRCASRIGSAPLSLPAEVNLRILEPPIQKKLVSRMEPPRILEIEGPLGWLGRARFN